MERQAVDGRVRIRAIAIAAGGVAAAAGLILIAPMVAQMVLDAAAVDAMSAPMTVEFVYVVVIFGAMLAMAIAGGAMTGIRALALGRQPGHATMVGAMLGLGGLFVTVGYAVLAGTVSRGASDGAALAVLAGVPAVALQVTAEEAYFRGWLQPLLARTCGQPVAVVAVALGFGGLHLIGGANGLGAVINLFAGGLMFGMLAARAGGIAGASAAHFCWNATEQLVLGLDPNPGVGGFGSVIDLDLAGSALWGGSEQGLNASLGMTFALAAVIVLLLPPLGGNSTGRNRATALDQPV